MKLSKTARNNILIFTILIFIAFINLTHDTNVDTSMSFLGLNSTSSKPYNKNKLVNKEIDSLSIDQLLSIKKVNATWQAQPNSISGATINQILIAWYEAKGTVISSPPTLDPQMALAVSIINSSSTQTIKLRLYTVKQQLLIHNLQSNLWLSFPIEMFSQLIPDEIFSS